MRVASEHHCRCCGADEAFATSDKPRSHPHTARFFVKLKLLFSNWPAFNSETGELIQFQPDDPVQMRKKLQILAGYDQVARITIAETAAVAASVIATREALRVLGEYGEIEVDGNVITIRRSKSIRYEAMGAKAFTKLDQTINEVAYAMTGIDPEELIMTGAPTR